MGTLLRRFFATPVFDNQEKYRQARLLNIILLALFGASLIYLLFAPIDPALWPRRILIIAPFLLTLLILWFAMRRGFVRFTGIIVVTAMWAMFTLAMSFNGGYSNSAHVGYMLVVLCAGLLIGKRAAIVWAVLSMLTSATIVIWSNQVSLNNLGFSSAIPFWVAQTMYLSVTAILLSLALKNIDEAIQQTQKELAERIKTEEKEQQRSELLARVLHLGKIVTEMTDLQTDLPGMWQRIREDLGFDRIGLFIYDIENNTMRGVFGTDRNGNMTEEWEHEYALDEETLFYKVLNQPDGLFYTDNFADLYDALEPDDAMYGVKEFAAAAGWKGDKPVSLISADQLLSNQPISDVQLEALRMFAGYVGLAIENVRLNAELERRVEERTAQLAAANKELEAFSYSVSHDLRTPLRGISGFVDILQNDFTERLQPQGREYLQRIRNNADRMNQLIDSLLVFSQTGRQQIRRITIDMNALITELLLDLENQYLDRQITWQVSNLPTCQADPTLMKQVLLNLMENAIKYTAPRATALIEIGANTSGRKSVYYIRDNGVGFDMQYAEKLFGVFQRLHVQDEFEGTGVGLAIVQRILQRHGGRIWAESEVDAGAIFYFSISGSARFL